jgi:hypothetical protein
MIPERQCDLDNSTNHAGRNVVRLLCGFDIDWATAFTISRRGLRCKSGQKAGMGVGVLRLRESFASGNTPPLRMTLETSFWLQNFLAEG